MKKLIGIINLEEVTECYDVEQDYKVIRANLKKYLKSLEEIKLKVVAFHENISKSNKSLLTLHKEKCSKDIKKNTELDYFTIHGCKVFKKIGESTAKPISSYQKLIGRISEAQKKVEKCIVDTRKNFKEHSQAHEEVVKDYAVACYPDTDSFLFKIGFVSIQKIVKKQDKYKESSLIEESKIYLAILRQDIQKMGSLKEECLNIGRSFYSGMKDEWIQSLEKVIQEIDEFEVDENQISDFVPAGAGENSFKQAKSDRQRQQQVQQS